MSGLNMYNLSSILDTFTCILFKLICASYSQGNVDLCFKPVSLQICLNRFFLKSLKSQKHKKTGFDVLDTIEEMFNLYWGNV